MSTVNTTNTNTIENDVEEIVQLPENPMPKRKINQVNDLELEIDDLESKKSKTSVTANSILNDVLDKIKQQKAIKPADVPVVTKNMIIIDFILDISFFEQPLKELFTSITVKLQELIPSFNTKTYVDITRDIGSSLEEVMYMLCNLTNFQIRFLRCPAQYYYTILLIYLTESINDLLIINKKDIREDTNFSIFEGFLLKIKVIVRLLSAPISGNLIYRQQFTSKTILNNLLIFIDTLNIIIYNCICFPIRITTFINTFDKGITDKAKFIYSLLEHLKRRTSLALSEF